jgi:beta-N-acetylhexosaminidase
MSSAPSHASPRRAFFAAFLLLLTSAYGAYMGMLDPRETEEVRTATVSDVLPSPSPLSDVLQHTIKGMSPLEKAGQLFVLGVPGTELTPDTEQFLRTYRPGGIILLEKNISESRKLQRFVGALRNTAGSKGALPFISVDQEGGVVSRLSGSVFETTSQKEIPEEMQAYMIARKRGEELRALGIRVNYAPVLDEGSENSFLKERLFVGSLEDKSLLGAAMVRGYIDAGVVPVPKHIPSHPDTHLDPHAEYIVSADTHNILEKNLLPFRTAVSSAQAPALMVSHAIFSSLDTLPASLSERTISFIREQLPFKGILITDDLEMGALSGIEPQDRALRALEVGADLVLFSGFKLSNKDHAEIIQRVSRAIETGELDTKKVDEKLHKILNLKESLEE